MRLFSGVFSPLVLREVTLKELAAMPHTGKGREIERVQVEVRAEEKKREIARNEEKMETEVQKYYTSCLYLVKLDGLVLEN